MKFFTKRICPVCAQDVFVHRTGIVADHSRSKNGRVMPRCPQVGGLYGVVHFDDVTEFADRCEEYRLAGR